MVMPNENGTAADITWTASQLSDNNVEVNYTVVVRGPSGIVVFMETTSGTTVSVTQGLGELNRLDKMHNAKNLHTCNHYECPPEQWLTTVKTHSSLQTRSSMRAYMLSTVSCYAHLPSQ